MSAAEAPAPQTVHGNFGRSTRALVVGLGRSGLAALEVLRERGLTLYATDETAAVRSKHAVEFAQREITMLEPLELDTLIDALDVAVLSPGVPLTSPVVRTLRAAHIPVLSEIEVAYRISPAPIIAITGTKGKTTTTALVGALLRTTGKITFVGGNIGNALIAETAHATDDAWVVAEISSFQLETIDAFRPKISTILNLSEDHLDRYGSMAPYIAAKERIFANQGAGDVFIGNLDDPFQARYRTTASAPELPQHVEWFSLAFHPLSSMYVQQGNVVWAPGADHDAAQMIMPVAEIPLLGTHNVANTLAALLICVHAGCQPAALRAGVRDFRGLSHRLELLGEWGGVRYIDDSKATNPGSVQAALEAVNAPVILIAGGKEKGTDFRELGTVIERLAKHVVLIGEAAAAIQAAVLTTTCERATSMADAVTRARAAAKPGDVVLLSPACASFDMFKSAEHRGDVFAEAVRAECASLESIPQ